MNVDGFGARVARIDQPITHRPQAVEPEAMLVLVQVSSMRASLPGSSTGRFCPHADSAAATPGQREKLSPTRRKDGRATSMHAQTISQRTIMAWSSCTTLWQCIT